MPTIKARKQADSSLRYTAVVRIRRQGKVLHQEAKTFAHRSAAERWGKHREVALEDPSALVRAAALNQVEQADPVVYRQFSGDLKVATKQAVAAPVP